MSVVLYHLKVPGFSGPFAVICFFVLSGFLITHLLLREQDRTGTISLLGFYRRRAFRILPAFFGFIAVYVVARLLLHLPIDWETIGWSVAYLNNYHYGAHALNHCWSLSVEEQFYALWPAVFLCFATRRRMLACLAAFVTGVVVYRWIGVIAGFNGDYVYAAFEMRADALAIGCALAVANAKGVLPNWLIGQSWLSGIALVGIVSMSVLNVNGPRYSWLLVAIASAIIIIQSAAKPELAGFRWLNLRPMRWLGAISYSLYLYHPLTNNLPARINVLPLQIAFALCLAAGSYYIIETPFLRWKDSMNPKQVAAPEIGTDEAVQVSSDRPAPRTATT